MPARSPFLMTVTMTFDQELPEHKNPEGRSSLRLQQGKLIKERREELGLTQQDLATALGYTQQGISHIECGRASIDAHVLFLLSRVLKCPADRFDVTSRLKK